MPMAYQGITPFCRVSIPSMDILAQENRKTASLICSIRARHLSHSQTILIQVKERHFTDFAIAVRVSFHCLITSTQVKERISRIFAESAMPLSDSLTISIRAKGRTLNCLLPIVDS